MYLHVFQIIIFIWNNLKYEIHTYKMDDIHTKLKIGMSFIPIFGMIMDVTISYLIWYEFHTFNFTVYSESDDMHNSHDSSRVHTIRMRVISDAPCHVC